MSKGSQPIGYFAGAHKRCNGTELKPNIDHMMILFQDKALKFRVLGTPISSHFFRACARSTSFRVGLLSICIVSGTTVSAQYNNVIGEFADLQLLALSSKVLIMLMTKWTHKLSLAT